jgi:hypothetical protein
MRIKRQLFRPGRRVEQTAHPFFTRRNAKASSPASGAPFPLPRSALLSALAEDAAAAFSIAIAAPRR